MQIQSPNACSIFLYHLEVKTTVEKMPFLSTLKEDIILEFFLTQYCKNFTIPSLIDGKKIKKNQGRILITEADTNVPLYGMLPG